MAGRVRLNVPPRLIESARAAQYANREAQGARELARRIESKVRQQRQAAKRAQPQAQTFDGQGAVFDAPALKRVPRIWRKRRPLVGGRHGVGWLHIEQNNPVVPVFSGTGSLELIITVGTGSGEIWRQVRHTVNCSRNFDGPPGDPSNFSTFHTLSQLASFPAGQSDIVFVFLLTQFRHTINSSGITTSYSAINTIQISFLITDDSITEATHPIPVYAQRVIDIGEFVGPGPGPRGPGDFRETGIYKYIGIDLQGDLDRIDYAVSSSAIFEAIAPDGTFNYSYSAQEAKASYAAFSGNAEIPVLGYKRDDPLAASTPTTERGVFGIIPGASVTAPITAEMRAARLEDEQVQQPAPSAENRTEPVGMIVAYDYHGGTYCRDQLARLGITLP